MKRKIKEMINLVFSAYSVNLFNAPVSREYALVLQKTLEMEKRLMERNARVSRIYL